MPKLAIQEALLPGATVMHKFATAAQLGFSAVELPAEDLDERLPEVYDALQTQGLAASGVNMGTTSGWLAADRATRAESAGYAAPRLDLRP